MVVHRAILKSHHEFLEHLDSLLHLKHCSNELILRLDVFIRELACVAHVHVGHHEWPVLAWQLSRHHPKNSFKVLRKRGIVCDLPGLADLLMRHGPRAFFDFHDFADLNSKNQLPCPSRYRTGTFHLACQWYG